MHDLKTAESSRKDGMLQILAWYQLAVVLRSAVTKWFNYDSAGWLAYAADRLHNLRFAVFSRVVQTGNTGCAAVEFKIKSGIITISLLWQLLRSISSSSFLDGFLCAFNWLRMHWCFGWHLARVVIVFFIFSWAIGLSFVWLWKIRMITVSNKKTTEITYIYSYWEKRFRRIMKVHDSLNVDVLNHVVQRRIDMSHRNKALVAIDRKSVV